ncbi:MAG TPA: DNA repair protein RadC [Candidatus Avirikenella pullistercoris]|nr:DNA repair protein RadC [Candidatus Avirikenella pullistercoris]
MVKKITPDWSEDTVAQEKLLYSQISALTDAELLGLLIGKSTIAGSATNAGAELLENHNNNLNELRYLDVNTICKSKGIGMKSAMTLAAAFELASRIKQTERPMIDTIRNNMDAVRLLEPIIGDLPHEEFWAIYLNGANRVVDKVRISHGGTNSSVVDIKIILQRAIERLASGLIIAHNHPSGDLTPSENDLAVTKKIKDGCSLLDIRLLDHIIIGNGQSFSFLEQNVL